MHPYFGTVSVFGIVKEIIRFLVFSQALFLRASMWFDAQQVVRLPDSRFGPSVHRFLPSSFFICKLLLEIVFLIRIYFLSFFISCS